MQRTLHSLVAVGGLVMASATSAALADSLSDNKVVRDRYGHPVISQLARECVRTRWEAGTDPCAPPRAEEPAPRPVAVASPARMLQMEDRTVYFDFDKADLNSTARSKLDSLASVLKSSADVQHATIVGHADRLGNADYNVKLSERRAQNVKDYLAKRGFINTSVAEVQAVGEDQQVKACEGVKPRSALIDCLAPNRRVHLDITYAEDKNVYYERPVSYNQQPYQR